MLFLLNSIVFSQENFILQIDDSVINIATDREYKTTINGKEVVLKLSEKDTLLYKTDMFSFKHPKGFQVSKSMLAEGVEQNAIMTAEGSGIMIQSYFSLNPTFLNEMMLNEVTKESISYGYEMKREDHIKTLNSGEEIIVTKAILTYKDDVNIYEISTIGGKDNGLLILTMITVEDFREKGEELIDLMWNTLEVTLVD